MSLPALPKLVNGATGAIGSAAVQLLKRLGAVVTAVCDTEHVELVRGLGADRIIHRSAEDFTKDRQTSGVVFDAVGKSSFGRCKRLLKLGGFCLSTDLGPFSQNPILTLITPLFGYRLDQIVEANRYVETGQKIGNVVISVDPAI